MGESIAVNYWTQHQTPEGIEELVIAQHPAIPVYDENGGYAGGYVDILGDKANAVRLTDMEANNRHKTGVSSAMLTWKSSPSKLWY